MAGLGSGEGGVAAAEGVWEGLQGVPPELKWLPLGTGTAAPVASDTSVPGGLTLTFARMVPKG